jgi:hypothetical protein
MNRVASLAKTDGIIVVCLVVGMCLAPLNALAQSETGPAKPDGPGAAKKEKEAIKPGNDRWPVKTASDLDVGRVNVKPVKTTVEAMLAIPRPADLPLDDTSTWLQDHRAAPAETTIWTVEADVTRCQLMPDGDYRVTIRGASGQTMVLEMPNPDPKFINPTGPFAGGIKSARVQFDSKEEPTRAPKEITRHAVITGIGFFSRAHGKKDANPGNPGNLIQLHPVLSIDWLEKPTK